MLPPPRGLDEAARTLTVYRHELPRNLRYPTRFPRRAGGGGRATNLVVGGVLAVLAAGAVGVGGGHAIVTAVHGADAALHGAGTAVPQGTPQQQGMALAAAHGWTVSNGQFTCLNWLWTRESGWRMIWNTTGSGAFGIPQALPASKMASAGADYMTNPDTQIRWGLGYIEQRYVTPCNAWDHETRDGWY
jgi:hypothetical protein